MACNIILSHHPILLSSYVSSTKLCYVSSYLLCLYFFIILGGNIALWKIHAYYNEKVEIIAYREQRATIRNARNWSIWQENGRVYPAFASSWMTLGPNIRRDKYSRYINILGHFFKVLIKWIDHVSFRILLRRMHMIPYLMMLVKRNTMILKTSQKM